jgi:hypothetical protein
LSCLVLSFVWSTSHHINHGLWMISMWKSHYLRLFTSKDVWRWRSQTVMHVRQWSRMMLGPWEGRKVVSHFRDWRKANRILMPSVISTTAWEILNGPCWQFEFSRHHSVDPVILLRKTNVFDNNQLVSEWVVNSMIIFRDRIARNCQETRVFRSKRLCASSLEEVDQIIRSYQQILPIFQTDRRYRIQKRDISIQNPDVEAMVQATQ